MSERHTPMFNGEVRARVDDGGATSVVSLGTSHGPLLFSLRTEDIVPLQEKLQSIEKVAEERRAHAEAAGQHGGVARKASAAQVYNLTVGCAGEHGRIDLHVYAGAVPDRHNLSERQANELIDRLQEYLRELRQSDR
ncbi:hypothetical protein [Salipiger thiooxidans]|uniref:hypothetical protein n=1 Tax=Salipiger thiooxidans TaxID=282683 RepID=UPI001CD6D114|nr:hypothetical protein [Salipiger thiooxidans]MCA0849701.1 hypothetical protein [Salipiger thiooxidans]